MRVLYIEPVGGHRGMHYYDFALCGALWELGVEPILATCDETERYAVSLPYQTFYPFRGIYGDKNVFLRGLNYLRAWREILKKASPGTAQIAHLHYFHLPWADYFFIRRLKRRALKIVITVHDVVPFHEELFSRFPLGKIYQSAERIIVHAEANKREIESAFAIDPQRVTVIPHGNYAPYVQPEAIEQGKAKERLGIPRERRVILFFGQIKKVKGLDHLIRAFAQVSKNYPQTLLLIAGQVWKDDFSRYERLIRSLGLEERVYAKIRHIADEEVANYFCAADLVALPYLRIYQSGVLLMACSYGRPVVASAVGGLPEVVKDGETGYLIPPADEVRLAEAIERILADKGRAEEMGRTAREMVETTYSWQKIAAETKKVYETLLAQERFEKAAGD